MLCLGRRAGVIAAFGSCLYLHLFHGAPFSHSRQQLFFCLHLDLLPCVLASLAGQRIARSDSAVLLRLVKVLDDAVAMLVEYVLGDALHAENLHVEALAVGEGIFDLVEGLLVHLVEVDGETCKARLLSASIGLPELATTYHQPY